MKVEYIKCFLKETRVPVAQIEDEEYLKYALTKNGALEDYEKFCDLMDTRFSGNTESWKSYFAKIRDEVIFDFKRNSKMSFFVCEEDMKKYNAEFPETSSEFYKRSQIGQTFLSIDLKEACFQVWKYLGIISENSWPEILEKYTDVEFIKNSKQFRSIVSGNLGPKRTVKVEKFLMWKIWKLLNLDLPLEAVVNDEIVYRLPDPGAVNPTEIQDRIYKELDLVVKVEKFRLHGYNLKPKKRKVKQTVFYGKENLETGEYTYHCLPSPLKLIAMKLLKGEAVEKYDTLFISDDFLCRYEDNIELEEIWNTLS